MRTFNLTQNIVFGSLMVAVIAGCSKSSPTYIWEGTDSGRYELKIRVDEKSQNVAILLRWTPPKTQGERRNIEETQVTGNMTAGMKCIVVNAENWRCSQPEINESISMFQGVLSHRIGAMNRQYRRID